MMKQSEIEIGTTVYIIESNRFITEAEVIRRNGNFYTIRFGNHGGIQVRRSRLFLSREEAESLLPAKPNPQRAFRSPYDYGA